MYDILLLVVGLIVLAKSSNITVDYAVKFSKLSGISQLTVGFVVLAVSTSLPELTIAIISSMGHNAQLSLGNVMGSSMADITLIFGVMALTGFTMSREDANEAFKSALIGCVVILFALAIPVLDFTFGIFLFLIFYAFFRMIISDGFDAEKKKGSITSKPALTALFYLLASVAAVVISAHVVVESAILLSNEFGIATAAIGATLISVGTSLPELTVNIAALRKKNIEIAVGDSMGSVATNLTLVFGTAVLFNPVTISGIVLLAAEFVVGSCILFSLLAGRGKFGKPEGLILLAIFVLYVATMAVVGRT